MDLSLLEDGTKFPIAADLFDKALQCIAEHGKLSPQGDSPFSDELSILSSAGLFPALHRAALDMALKVFHEESLYSFFESISQLEQIENVENCVSFIRSLSILAEKSDGCILSHSSEILKADTIRSHMYVEFLLSKPITHLWSLLEKCISFQFHEFVERHVDPTPLLVRSMDVLLLGDCVWQLAVKVLRQVTEEKLNALEEQIDSSFETPLLGQTLRWVSKTVHPFLRGICDVHVEEGGGNEKQLARLERLEDSLYEFAVGRVEKLRRMSIFDMIIDFPDSLPGLRDLKSCLEVTLDLQSLIKSVSDALESRLLHAGARTEDVITTYVSTLRVLAFLDSSGFVARSVLRNVAAYLRQRSGALRCIVLNMVEEGGELCDEMFRKAEKESSDENGGKSGDNFIWTRNLMSEFGEENEAVSEEWLPRVAVGAQRRRSISSARRKRVCMEEMLDNSGEDTQNELHSLLDSVDTIQAMVAIYGNPDVFVNEYRTILAERLLKSVADSELDWELKVLELLKIRFGEKSTRSCEVMLKDMADSKRITQQFKNDCSSSAVRTTIISKYFWPSLQTGESFHPHDVILNMRKQFEDVYTKVKAPRRLLWKDHMGSLLLEVEVAGVKEELSLPPMAASVLLHIGDSGANGMCLQELATVMKTSVEAVSKRTSYLSGQGIISESSERFYLRRSSQYSQSYGMNVTEMDTEGGIQSAQEQDEEEMNIFKSFVIAMITNLGPLGVADIDNKLRMFCLDPPYDKPVDRLKQLLVRMAEEEVLSYSSGVYSLRK